MTEPPVSGNGPPAGGEDVDAIPSHEDLMRYLDGELSPEERRKVEQALEGSTELQRELAVYRMFHRDLSRLRLHDPPPGRSIWGRVNRRLSRPVGWLLMALGGAVWLAHAVYLYFTSVAPWWEKAATSAIVIGILILFASVIHDRYREWTVDPYRHVER
jgi:anti-sigma factor RsiW